MSTKSVLKLLRISEGHTQAALAEKLQVSRSFLCEVENGTKQPGMRFLKRFASVLHVPMALLVEDETDPDPGLSAELRRILCKFLAERIGGRETR